MSGKKSRNRATAPGASIIAKARQIGMTRLTMLTEHGVDIDAIESIPCGRCNGRGHLRGASATEGEFTIPCPGCDGTGWAPHDPPPT